jgi:VWFA-related protein
MTGDTGALDTMIRHLRAGGETALYDAIVVSSHKLRLSRKNAIVRPLIIVISDGVDTASKGTLAEAVETATRSEAAIFVLDATSIYETRPMGRPALEKLTRETGGFVLPARENSGLKNAFSTIEKILRNQYALGYAPPNLEPNGEFRPIEVSVHQAGLKVHSRRGYYAPRR